MQRLAQVNATAAKLRPAEEALKSCRQQAQQQKAQLQEYGVLQDRLASCKHDTEVIARGGTQEYVIDAVLLLMIPKSPACYTFQAASKERQDLQQQLYDVKAASADAALTLTKLKVHR